MGSGRVAEAVQRLIGHHRLLSEFLKSVQASSHQRELRVDGLHSEAQILMRNAGGQVLLESSHNLLSERVQGRRQVRVREARRLDVPIVRDQVVQLRGTVRALD